MKNTKKLRNLDWQEILEALSRFASASQSQQLLKNTKPFTDNKMALNSVDTIEECKQILVQGVRPRMESLELFDTWFSLVKKGSQLSPLQLKDIKFFLIETLALTETVKPFTTINIKSQKELLINAEPPLTRIENLLTDDGFIRSDASPNLSQLNKNKKELSQSIRKTLEKLVKSYEIEDVVQDRFVTTREGRWVLPIKSGMQHRFKGVIHDSSQSKQTVFMEPTEVVNTNNKIRQIEIDIKAEIQKLLKEISHYFYLMSDDLQNNSNALLFFDLNLSKAQLALKTEAVPFNFSSEKIELVDLKNPYLLLNNEKVIANTIELSNDKPVLLLSGPNAGGKTVLLKSIGLALQMARCGLHICTSPNSSLPFIREISTSVGDHQNLSENLSSFASHLKILQEATTLTGLDHLILIDEICSSTDPEEGAALARSFIEKYVENNVFAIVTSHFNYLKNSLAGHEKIVSGSLEFSLDSGPTYKYIQGVSGQSLAIQTAKRAGVSKDIIETAISFLSSDKQNLISNIDEVTLLKANLANKSKELEQAKHKYNQQNNKYRILIEKYEKEKEQLLEKSVLKAEKKIEQMIQVNKAGEVLKKNTELLKIKHQLPEIISGNKNSLTAVSNASEFAEKYPPGSKVFIPSLNKDGLVQSAPNSKGLVDVMSQSMRLQLSWKLLKPNTNNLKNPAEQTLKNKGFFNMSHAGGDKALDIRGFSVDEAIDKIEVELDRATTIGVDRVKIIHGHGTNSLKRAVRSYLSRCLYVKSWTSGTKNSGGDGTTWVVIKDD